jgi:hypothetical protein
MQQEASDIPFSLISDKENRFQLLMSKVMPD